MLYTYQQVLHLIENDEAYKQKEPTGKKSGKERNKDRQRERKKEKKKEERILTFTKERMTRHMNKERRERDKTVTKMVITYMYIILNTTFTSTCYILTNKCCT